MELFMVPTGTPALDAVAERGTAKDISRRKFFQITGALAGGSLLIDACRRSPSASVYLGKGDTGLLNYLYIIAQVQAGFYTQAYANPYYNPSSTQLSEYQLMADLRDHHLAYVGLYQKILGSSALSKVVLQLSQVSFADRTSTLSHATTLQDLSIGAYNGVAQLISDTSYIPLFAKISSVEGRHAQYVRDALNYNTFGDGTVTDSNGLGQVLSPNNVMPPLQTYMQTILDFSGIPTF